MLLGCESILLDSNSPKLAESDDLAETESKESLALEPSDLIESDESEILDFESEETGCMSDLLEPLDLELLDFVE